MVNFSEEIFTGVLAEDHEPVRKGLITLLQIEFPHLIIHAVEDGKQLIDVTRRLHSENSSRPSFLITDYSMPVLNGGEALTVIRKFNKTVPAIMYSLYRSVDLPTLQIPGLTYISKAESNSTQRLIEEIRKYDPSRNR